MYVRIFQNKLKVNNLTKNADELLIVLDNNVMLFNYLDFVQNLQENKPNYFVMDETFRDVQLQEANQVLNLQKFIGVLKDKFNLTINEDFVVMSDLTWNDNGLNLGVRVTIPQYVVFQNSNYTDLVTHVKGLAAINRAFYVVNNGLIYLYFAALLPEHEALLGQDSNILIEYK